MKFINQIRNKVRELPSRNICFPEGEDTRILSAAAFMHKEQLANPIVLGNTAVIEKTARENKIDISSLEIINPEQDENDEYINQLYELRKHKGMDKSTAKELLKNTLYYGAMLVRNNKADGAVAGSINTTGNVLRAAIQIVGLAEGIKAVSSSFLMVLENNQVLTYGDCAVIPDPDIDQLASITLSTSLTHQKVVGEEPVVAMLSFSTKGSAEHDSILKIAESIKCVKKINPDLNIDGELQFDAAFNSKVGSSKAPGSKVAGKANVYIFPDLNSGNIGYKITQWIGNAQAIGPIIQGLAKPYNDLSRGCTMDDVVNTACICSLLI